MTYPILWCSTPATCTMTCPIMGCSTPFTCTMTYPILWCFIPSICTMIYPIVWCSTPSTCTMTTLFCGALPLPHSPFCGALLSTPSTSTTVRPYLTFIHRGSLVSVGIPSHNLFLRSVPFACMTVNTVSEGTIYYSVYSPPPATRFMSLLVIL